MNAITQQAIEARRRLQWMPAALLFTEAADDEEQYIDANLATVEALRRDAYLCLNRTEQFQKHRAAQRKADPKRDFSVDWRHPTGKLVRALAGRLSTRAIVRTRSTVVEASS